jgi:4a-hydroxytetrahydrobiopterin dehydratase
MHLKSLLMLISFCLIDNPLVIAHEFCIPCEGGIAPLSSLEIAEFMESFSDWILVETIPQKIERIFSFKDFIEAMQFINIIATIAEKEGHHPNIYSFYNKVTIQFYTHAINGLSANDFIMAGLVDDIIYDHFHEKFYKTQ